MKNLRKALLGLTILSVGFLFTANTVSASAPAAKSSIAVLHKDSDKEKKSKKKKTPKKKSSSTSKQTTTAPSKSK